MRGKGNILIWMALVFFVFSSTACESFTRKFVRKPKVKEGPPEEQVLVPQEYARAAMPMREQARQYYIFWKSWHDELSAALLHNGSRKRAVGCFDEALKNLKELRRLLVDEKQPAVDKQITAFESLRKDIDADYYGNFSGRNARRVDLIRRAIARELPYGKLGNFVRVDAQ